MKEETLYPVDACVFPSVGLFVFLQSSSPEFAHYASFSNPWKISFLKIPSQLQVWRVRFVLSGLDACSKF